MFLHPPAKSAVSLQKPFSLGFSLTELMIVGGMAAALFTTASLAYRTITVHQRLGTTFNSVNLGPAITTAFYGSSSGTMDVYTAPNFGMTARAEVMRNVFWDDIAHSSAVMCLPRPAYAANPLSAATDKVTGINYIHPLLLPVPNPTGLSPAPDPQGTFTYSGVGFTVDHPNAFIQVLLNNNPAGYPFPFTGQAYRGVPAAASVNGSIFVLQMSTEADKVAVRAIYDIDFINIADPGVTTTPNSGTYASVRRYVPVPRAGVGATQDTGLTHYYDVLYPGPNQPPSQFGPLFACYERSVRRVVTEADSIQAFKRAVDRPFYFVWWPDPATPRLEGTSTAATFTASDPRYYYRAHENQTCWMFTVPMFPSL